MSDDEELLLEAARHIANVTRYQVGLVLRTAADAERAAFALQIARERQHIRDMAATLRARRGRALPAPEDGPGPRDVHADHDTNIIPFRPRLCRK